jgi:hypothetical protein
VLFDAGLIAIKMGLNRSERKQDTILTAHKVLNAHLAGQGSAKEEG